MQMEMCIKGNGKTIKHMEKEFILKLMDQPIQACGLKIFSMDLEYKNGMMDHPTKDNTMMEPSMVKENLHGLMALYMKEIFKII